MIDRQILHGSGVATNLRVVLKFWVQDGSFAYRVIEVQSRDDYLDGVTITESLRTEDGWW